MTSLNTPQQMACVNSAAIYTPSCTLQQSRYNKIRGNDPAGTECTVNSPKKKKKKIASLQVFYVKWMASWRCLFFLGVFDSRAMEKVSGHDPEFVEPYFRRNENIYCFRANSFFSFFLSFSVIPHNISSITSSSNLQLLFSFVLIFF